MLQTLKAVQMGPEGVYQNKTSGNYEQNIEKVWIVERNQALAREWLGEFQPLNTSTNPGITAPGRTKGPVHTNKKTIKKWGWNIKGTYGQPLEPPALKNLRK